MGHWMIALGAVLAAASVAAGAFGAHALAESLDPRSLMLWETASRYLMYGAFGTIVAGLLERLWATRLLLAAGWMLLAGTLLFSGTVFALSLGAPPFFGAITPLGGLLLIAGFLVIAWAAGDRYLEAKEDAEE